MLPKAVILLSIPVYWLRAYLVKVIPEPANMATTVVYDYFCLNMEISQTTALFETKLIHWWFYKKILISCWCHIQYGRYEIKIVLDWIQCSWSYGEWFPAQWVSEWLLFNANSTSSCMTYHTVCNNSYTTGTASGAGTAYASWSSDLWVHVAHVGQ